MTKVLHSFAEAALRFAEAAVKTAVETEASLHLIGRHIEKEAKEEFGTYQPAVGPFPAWEHLAPTTLDGWGPFPGKIALGYAPPDNPLVREGDLKNSISHDVDGLSVYIGSPEDKMLWHELGTSNMPPRPVLGPAAFKAKEAIHKLIGAALVVGLVGPTEIMGLGYNFELPKDL